MHHSTKRTIVLLSLPKCVRVTLLRCVLPGASTSLSNISAGEANRRHINKTARRINY